ncbi:MAG: protein kinase [Bacteroidetes bacterium]|jgi:hypothetical protein|nr:protein kinase [Bacteroidota bacterium]
MPNHPNIGTEIDGYRIQEVLGQGGMGIVYKAEDVALSRTVALKMIDPALARDAAFLRRFRSEARALARIDSSHIVRVHALRETSAGLFIVMEYVDGGTVSDLLSEGPVPWQQALPVIRQTLTALHDAHSVGVWHRDIKPGNILISSTGKVKVTDFGLAKLEQKGDGMQTVTQGISGTLYYMSPEQVKGAVDLDHRSDLYSAGMTIYKMLTDDVPFDRSAGDFAIMRKIVEEPVPRLDGTRDGLPPVLVEAVAKALKKDPDARFPSAEAMLQALEGLDEGAKGAPVPVRKSRSSTAPPARTSRGRVVAGAVLAIVVLLGLLGFLLWPWSNGEDVGGTTANPADAPPYAIDEFTTDPAGALVRIDGEAAGLTPLRGLRYSADRVPVRVEKAGYAPVDTVLALTAEQPTRVALSLTASADRADEGADDAATEDNTAEDDADTSPDVAVGTLRVTSTPSEATVYVNGERAGQTPYEDATRTPGPVTVRLEKDGHNVWQQQAVEVAAGATREVAATLTATAAPEPAPEPEPAPVASVALRATATPGGTVAVGGQAMEGTGQFQLTPGTHTIRFTHPEHGTVDSTLTVSANTSHELTAYFEQQVNVNTDGAWAGLWINGELSERTTPQQLTLGPGEHTVRARIDRTDALYIDGGLHRVEVGGEERSREDFTGTAQTIRVAPTFRPTRHVLVFRVRERE